MNFHLSDIPERNKKPRNKGVTMVMDKGLSLRQAEDLVEVSGELIDLIKLGFGTSYITPNLKEKIKFYQEAGIQVYLGGTLFEAFLVRGKFDEYCKLLDKLGIDCAEVSDGSITIAHELKCEFISLMSKNFKVLSEVGSKEAGIIIHPNKWISMMQAELDAGSWKVIAEARESGNVGIYRPSGKAHVALVNKILNKIPEEKILWETPQKSQQVWFIKLLGANVNLGNIAPEEVIPLETLRIGVRGDTFFQFLHQDATPIKVEKPVVEQEKKTKASKNGKAKKNVIKMKEISVTDFKKLTDSGEPYQLIDVREEYEYEISNIGGELIPMGEVMQHVEKIARDKKVVVHCRSGARSANIIQALESRHNFDNLYNLKGGILAYADEVDQSVAKY